MSKASITAQLDLTDGLDYVDLDVSSYDLARVSVALAGGAWDIGIVGLRQSLDGETFRDLYLPFDFDGADGVTGQIQLAGAWRLRAIVARPQAIAGTVDVTVVLHGPEGVEFLEHWLTRPA